ncbi:MAG TPA: hypothetical protein VK208_22775 [Pyrinomonadaceae bacterium]|jgi:hypothetical protein|nr:hypothetical protein [Pyrinomonadaceae bacterium]
METVAGIFSSRPRPKKRLGNSLRSEFPYRRGFEAALRRRDKNSATPTPRTTPAEGKADEAFQRGYERGLNYHQSLREKYKA